MKEFFLVVGTVVYTLFGLLAFQTTIERDTCSKNPKVTAVILGAFWPISLAVVGGVVLFENRVDVWRCSTEAGK